MKFSQALENESRKTYTENGATAYNTTGDALLDLFGSIGSLRKRKQLDIERLFADAYNEDKLNATKCLFYARDVRGGLGERNTFRILLRYAAIHHPEAIRPNIDLIPFYGRYDDWYTLVGTPLEDIMWEIMRHQLDLDEKAMKANKPCSLMAKWLKTPDASSKETRKLGILTAKKLDLTVYVFKRKLRALRKYLKVVEVDMSAKHWGNIEYASVPSKAMSNYRKAFAKHDQSRFEKFLTKVEKGEAKINSSTLFPYDLIEKYIQNSYGGLHPNYDRVIEAQWKALPDYVGMEANAIVIADTSGSMQGRPLNSAVGLAIYFAERNKGPYHGIWMSFSEDSKIQRLKGETLAQKLAGIDTMHWDGNTNLERAFMHILQIAKDNHVDPEDMVKSLIVISDMQIDRTVGEWSFYDEMRKRFKKEGYEIPNVVYWNVDCRDDTFHADKSRKGVQICSGQSASTFKNLMASVGMTPVEMMQKVLGAERYDQITVD